MRINSVLAFFGGLDEDEAAKVRGDLDLIAEEISSEREWRLQRIVNLCNTPCSKFKAERDWQKEIEMACAFELGDWNAE